jgi:hypothetical protein
MKIADAIQESWSVVDSKGFHDRPRGLFIYSSLFHSEISEALEEIRSGNPAIWYTAATDGKDKPCGEATELVDLLIRVFDYSGVHAWHDLKAGRADDTSEIEADWLATSEKARVEFATNFFMDDAAEFTGFLHLLVDQFVGLMREEKPDLAKQVLGNVVWLVLVYFLMRGWDFDAVYREKMEFNKLRSFRHGNKTV